MVIKESNNNLQSNNNLELDRKYHVRSIKRAIRLLKLFNFKETELHLSELAKKSGLDVSTTRRILLTMESEGLIEFDRNTGAYQLGVTCLNLGSVFLSNIELPKRVYPALADVRRITKETVHLAILDNMEAVYLEKLESPLPIAVMRSGIGKRLPAYCTGLGKILLSYEDLESVHNHYSNIGLTQYTNNTITCVDKLIKELEESREQGYSLDNMEHEIGVCCIAAPIRDHTGRVVAALSIAGPENRIATLIENNSGIGVVIEAGNYASHLLGYVNNS
jgi:DNA-binding IclR family transcriptional regulator